MLAPIGTMVFYSQFDDAATWKNALQARLPGLRVLQAHEVDDPAEIDFALVWKPPERFFDRMSGLRLRLAGEQRPMLLGLATYKPMKPSRLAQAFIQRCRAYIFGSIHSGHDGGQFF